MIIQFCGLSGSGKTTIANRVKQMLDDHAIKCEVIDGDVYRKKLCPDLGFSKADRNENIRRLAFVAGALSKHGVVAIICAINPYDAIRKEVAESYPSVYTVHINCGINTLLLRDTKQLYHRAMLPDGHPNKIHNLTGVNDPFETPTDPDLVIDTDTEDEAASAGKLFRFIISSRQDDR